MNIIRILVIVAAAALLCACSKVTPENFAKVKTGMSVKEVKDIMGTPTEEKTGGALGITGTTLTNRSGDKTAEFTFVNDSLMSSSSNFK